MGSILRIMECVEHKTPFLRVTGLAEYIHGAAPLSHPPEEPEKRFYKEVSHQYHQKLAIEMGQVRGLPHNGSLWLCS